MIDKNTLPDHWEIKRFWEIGTIVSGGTPSTKESDFWNGDIVWVTPADLSGYYEKHISKGRKSISVRGLSNSSARLVPKGSVVFSSRAPIGYVAIASVELCTNQGFKSIIPNELIYSDFLYYYLKAAKNQAEKVASGTTFKEISSKAFSNLEIPLPPLNDQHQIVSKIEELFSKLDKGNQQLQSALQLLKVYRQSLFKANFKGKRSISFDEYVESSQNGLSKRKGTTGEEFKVLRLADITNNMINDSDPRSILMDENEINKYKIVEDDLICLRVNGSKDLVGKLIHASNKNEKDNWAFCDHFIRFKLDSSKAYAKFFHYYFSTLEVRKYIQENMVTSAGQNTVSQGTIKNVMVPDFSKDEQVNIVKELESKFSLCNMIEETLNRSLRLSESLKQSILKQAFEGKLI
jgi:type I restriction enzyme, S subunit